MSPALKEVLVLFSAPCFPLFSSSLPKKKKREIHTALRTFPQFLLPGEHSTLRESRSTLLWVDRCPQIMLCPQPGLIPRVLLAAIQFRCLLTATLEMRRWWLREGCEPTFFARGATPHFVALGETCLVTASPALDCFQCWFLGSRGLHSAVL